MSIDLLTPAEFAESEFVTLKEFLGTYDIQINKVGLIGYLVNLLGNIKYDSQTYYNELFKNAFIPTTVDINSLYLHSSIYNYVPGKANPSIALGTINFDFSLLSSPGNDIIKRQIVLTNLTFRNEQIQFTSKVKYMFIEEVSNNQTIYYAILTYEDGQIEYISSPSSLISVPFKNVKQHTIQEQIISIPNYEYGTNYSIIIDSEDEYLFDLTVGIRLSNKQYDIDTDYDNLSIEYISYLSNPGDMVCFLKPIDDKRWELKLGSGLHGMYSPNSILKLQKHLTIGKTGNILINSKVMLTQDTVISTFYTSITNGENEKVLNLMSLFELNFEYSYNGSDSVKEKELQKKLINYIQTRDTLISKKDFYNLKYESESEFVYSFRKSLLKQNTFFFYKLILTPYSIPAESLEYNIPRIITTNIVSNIIDTQEYDALGELISGNTYKYNIRACDGFNYSDISNTAVVTITGSNNKINLVWDEFIDAESYTISVTEDDINYKYFQTTSNSCSDFGNKFIDSVLDFNGVNYIYYPKYIINNKTFISPFMYKYNSHMDWYDGYIFNNSLTINFTSMESNIVNAQLPVCYFQIQYDDIQKKTTFFVKSYQEISSYQLNLTLTESLIIDQPMVVIDANTFYLDYSEGNIIEGEHELILTLIDSINSITTTFTSSTFYQIKKITDQLFLPTFENGDGNKYILNIPLIEEIEYNDNELFYVDLFINTFAQNLISEKRFPSDNIQVRFLNTYKLPGTILQYNTVQQYTFDLLLPLKLSINILLNKEYITNENIKLTDEQETIYLQLAQELQDSYTGMEIKYYNSKLIEFIHYARDYIKQVSIEVTDSDNNIISNGFESVSEQATIEAIQEDESVNIIDRKMRILDFFPIYIYWDLENIDIEYRFDL